MKTTIVPAQITTVEDKIAGSLGLSQLLLLITPVFIGSLLYIILPPFTSTVGYKLVLLVILTAICGLLAIRIKGTLVLHWLVLLLRYRRRPRYYVYDKRSTHGREQHLSVATDLEANALPAAMSLEPTRSLSLSTADIIEVERLMADPSANLSFATNKKGQLYVRVTQTR